MRIRRHGARSTAIALVTGVALVGGTGTPAKAGTPLPSGPQAAASHGQVEDPPPYTAYARPTPPALGEAGTRIVDPTFGTQIMRITKGGGRHAYSYWPVFNRNSTRMYVRSAGSGPAVYDFDPDTFTLGQRRAVFVGGTCEPEDAIWSGTHPDTLFCHDGAGRVRSYNVVTNAWTTVTHLGMPTWQMSKSIDDQVFAFTRRDSAGNPVGWVAYDRRTGVVTKTATTEVDEVHVDKSGRYVVHQTGNEGAGAVETIVYDLQSGARTELRDDTDFAPSHYDTGTGTVIGYDNWQNRILKRNLSAPKAYTVLMQFPAWLSDSHVSALADDERWVVVSRYGSPTGALAGEIFLLATDGSGTVRHIAHHQSVGTVYEHAPHASMRRDGRFITFTSNWGQGTGDVFVAKVDSTGDYQFVATSSPAGTRALRNGVEVAVFTTNTRTVRFAAPARRFSESTTARSVQVGYRLRRLPASAQWSPQMVNEQWFRDWFPQAVQDTGPDLLDHAMRYVTGAPANPPLEGDADYGPLVGGVRQEGADYNDYLQIAAAYPDGIDDPEPLEARSLDCSGYVRMVFGYRAGWPLKRVGTSTSPALGIPRRSVEMAAAPAGVEIIARNGDVAPGPADLARLAPGDLVFFDADDGDGEAIDHVGIYLGVDDGVDAAGAPDEARYHRFLSSRKTVNGPTMGDVGGWSVLDRSTSLYSRTFRSARRL